MNSYSASHHLTELIINNCIRRSSPNMGHYLPLSLVVFHHHQSLFTLSQVFIRRLQQPLLSHSLFAIVSGYPPPTPAIVCHHLWWPSVVTIHCNHWHPARGWPGATYWGDDEYESFFYAKKKKKKLLFL
jgi:hypothetical protein